VDLLGVRDDQESIIKVQVLIDVGRKPLKKGMRVAVFNGENY